MQNNNNISKTISKTFFISISFSYFLPSQKAATTAFPKQYPKHFSFSLDFLLLTPQKAATTAFQKQYAKEQPHF